MSKIRCSYAAAALAAILFAGGMRIFVMPPMIHAQNAAAQRTVQGVVTGSGDAPLSSSIVYLKDTKTLSIRSFISTADGSYRFGQMTNGTDYELWADYKGKKSSVKALSSFDNRKQTIINLKIDAK